MAILVQKDSVFTLAQYLRKEERAFEKHEFFNGQIVKKTNNPFFNNLILTNFLVAINRAAMPFLCLGSNQKVFIESENMVTYPDGIVVSEAPIFYKDQEFLLTNPLLIVEVLSRSTQAYDKQGKFDLYTNLPSFHEYVMVDPKRYFVETRFREEEDLWRIKTEKDPTKSVLLRSIGISISLEAIYKKVVFPPAKTSRK